MKRKSYSWLLAITLLLGALAALALPGKALAETGAAKIGEESYVTLAAAFEAAHAGDVVKLDANVSVTGDVDVPTDVTLDLNGFDLTVSGELLADSGELKDSTNGDGKIVITKGNLTLNTDNVQFPIYDKLNGAYCMFDAKAALTDPYQRFASDNTPRLKAQYKITFTNNKAYQLLAQGDHGIQLAVSLSYEGGTVGSAKYVFADDSLDLIKDYGEAAGSKVFSLSFMNFAEYGTKILVNNAEFTSCGVEKGKSSGNYTAAGKLEVAGSTSTYNEISSSYPATRMYDDSIKMGLNDCAGHVYKENGEIVYDLGRQCFVTSYKIYNMADPNVYGGLKSWELFTSADKVEWTLVETVSNEDGGLHTYSFDDGVSARYFKLVATDAYGNTKDKDKKVLRIGEFEVYGWTQEPKYVITYSVFGKYYDKQVLELGEEIVAPAIVGIQAPDGNWAGGWEKCPDNMPAGDLMIKEESQPVTNLAINSTVTINGYSVFQNGPSYLIDSDSNTPNYESAQQVAMTWVPDGSIVFDLHKVCSVTGYRLYNYKYIGIWGGVTKWTVLGSVNGTEWSQLHTGSIPASTREITEGVDFSETKEVRYIKLVVDAANTGKGSSTVTARTDPEIRICEFQIWGTGGCENLALSSRGTRVVTDMTVSTAKNETTDYTLAAINDGTKTFSTQFYTIANYSSSKDNHFIFDFGTVCDVYSYRLYHYRYASAQGGIKTWHIDGSIDGINWTTYTSGAQYAAEVSLQNYSQEGTFDTPIRVRFLKLVVDSCWEATGNTTKQARLYEVMFIGEEVNPNMKNLALAKNGAVVSTTYSAPEGHYENDNGDLQYPYVDAENNIKLPITNLIDGKALTQCRYQWDENGAILFDLGATHSLSYYYIYNYQYPYEWCINKSWSVYTSVDGNVWSAPLTGSIDASGFEGSVNYINLTGGVQGSAFAAGTEARYVKLVIDEVLVGGGLADSANHTHSQEDCDSIDVRFYEFQIFGE